MPYANSQGLSQFNPGLSNLSQKYANDTAGFIHNKLPVINVAKESDKYYVFGRDHFQIPETLRADGAKANRVNYTLSTSTYSLDEHSLEEVVTDRARANADKGLQPDVDAMENLTSRIMLRKELQAKNVIFTTTSFSNNHSLTSTLKWDLLTNTSDPIGDVATATSVIMGKTGQKANTVILGYAAWKGLTNHPNILERIKYSERGIINTDLIEAVFDVSNVIVGNAIYDTNVEGAPATSSYIWDLDAFVGYMEPRPKLKSASALYQFVKSNYAGKPFAVRKYRDDEVKGDVIEVSTMHDSKAVASLSGYLIRGVN